MANKQDYVVLVGTDEWTAQNHEIFLALLEKTRRALNERRGMPADELAHKLEHEMPRLQVGDHWASMFMRPPKKLGENTLRADAAGLIFTPCAGESRVHNCESEQVVQSC